MNDRTNAVILGGTGMRLLLLIAEDVIRMLELRVAGEAMNGVDHAWLDAQKRFINQLREANPKE